jgi:polyhydroxyalkanoate synthesis regulator phasin
MKKNGKKVAEHEELDETEERNRFLEISRKVLLASFGAVALAQDEIEDFVNRLVERGEIAERDARKLLREVTEKRRKSAEHEMDKRLEEVLDQLNVPSKADIDSLVQNHGVVRHKVDELKKVEA